MNRLITENDQKNLARYTAMIASHMKASRDAGHDQQTIAEYRAMMLAINPYKYPPGYKPAAVASYTPKLQLKPGLTAAVAIPEGKGPFPTIIHAHGHGLRAGRPPEYEPWMREMASYGFVVMFPDYRWQPEASFDDQMDDMLYAIDWAKKNGTRISCDPNRMIIGGDSAGGGLAIALLMKTMADPDGPRFVALECVDGSIGGPRENQRILDQITSDTPLPPIIMMVGSSDAGPLAQAANASLTFLKSKKNFELFVYYGMPHDFMKFPGLDIMHVANADMMTWLKKVV
ncbi:MAG: alpha/beta hydrolase [Janthinobacterium lividum]